ncbi:MAG: sigma 54-interacting transcriptional regulator [Deltaproteobacteria bacterium]|nr:sigma 54-interacting transcriptional regulator [Deltaproteobacteria bacterium]
MRLNKNTDFKGRVLVVDDERQVRKIIQIQLQNKGFEVFTAQNGREGLEVFHELKPQILIVDLKMPEMGGIELLESLKRNEDSDYAIIVLTGHETDQQIERCYQLGVQSFLRKPVNFYELLGLINQANQVVEYSIKLKHELKKKKQANEMLMRIFNQLSESVICLDHLFKIKFLSEKTCDLLDVSLEETINQSALSILGNKVAGGSGVLAKLTKDKMRHQEIQSEFLTQSGKVIPVSMSLIPMYLDPLDKKFGWLILFNDQWSEEKQWRVSLTKTSFGPIVSGDKAMHEIFDFIESISLSKSTVLIEGESGTGKELVAREIHKRSKRAQGPFHAINCAAVTPSLLESEFFGHVKGAFTGAHQRKSGRFEVAHKGTLFLDEIAEIPLALQPKILRVLQEEEFELVGSTKTIKVDIRVIAATNKNLMDMVKQGLFRDDLFYRLHVVPIKLPPLRQRLGDISLLVSSIIFKLNKSENREVRQISNEALKLLLKHDWPGNVRELFHAVEYAFAVSKDASSILKEHLPAYLKEGSNEEIEPSELSGNEKDMIIKVLNQTGFNRGKTAALLGINPSTLYRKMKKYHISS